MPNVWCVRANAGQFTEHFVNGGYAAIGWNEIVQDLDAVKTRDELSAIVRAAYPDEQSALVIGNFVGQISRFLLEVQAGDYIVTPAMDTDRLRYGEIGPDPSYFYATGDDGCPYQHRRRVKWEKEQLNRGDFTIPFQNTMRSALTVYAVSQRDEFLVAIGRIPPPPAVEYDSHSLVLHQVLELDDKEFEVLVSQLLIALDFESAEVVGKTGDRGVDVKGELNIANLVRLKVYVQAKRHKLGSRVKVSEVLKLRQTIASGGQGGLITTADFQGAAEEAATEPGFPRIGLINGRQLVDLLVEHWADISPEFQERLRLKPGLVRA